MSGYKHAPVLPSTLHPGLTRASLGSRSRLYIEKYAPRFNDFVQTDDGILLPPRFVAERDRARGEIVLAETAALQKDILTHQESDRLIKAARILGRSSITEEGCMVDGLRYNQRAAEYILAIAEQDWGSATFETDDDVEHVRLCSTPDCCNTRHYDLEFSRPTLRERRVELDLAHYSYGEDGAVKTIWGDELPPYASSLADFMDFARKNYPYVPYDKSQLSATSMSQLRIVPVTGCWEAWQYYCRPEDGLNWQFDGYGRLYNSFKSRHVDRETGEVITVGRRGHWLAHRVVWRASGRHLKQNMVLNHMCGYRRCCNPTHIEQVTTSRNNSHGRDMRDAKREICAVS